MGEHLEQLNISTQLGLIDMLSSLFQMLLISQKGLTNIGRFHLLQTNKKKLTITERNKRTRKQMSLKRLI